MKTIKKTSTKLKFDGMTFLHYSKADDTKCHMKEYALINGVQYFRMKDGKENIQVELTEDDNLVDTYITLPTAEEIKALERKDLVVSESGELKAVENKPAIQWHPAHPGKKMKARYLNPKNGNYVSYVRAIQLKLV